MGIEAISSSMAGYDRTALAQSQPANASPQPAAPKGGGGGRVKGGGGAKPADSADSAGGASGASGSSGATKTYDPADTNQDGVVSYAEALAYSSKHPNAVQTQAQKAATASQLQAGLNAYQQGQQANSTTASSLLFAA